jgi:hypothetical protein
MTLTGDTELGVDPGERRRMGFTLSVKLIPRRSIAFSLP